MAFPVYIAFIIKTAIMTGVSYAVAKLTAKKPEDQFTRPQEFDKPVAEEGEFYEIVFGLGWIEAPKLSWWGHKKAIPNIARESGSYYVASYGYAVGSHFILTQGGNDGMIAVKIGDYHTWPDPENMTEYSDDGETTIVINQPVAFGGNMQGGGVSGQIDIQYGASDQTINTYLYALQGANVSANRGFTGAILRQVVCGTSPHMPPWKFLLKRVDTLSTDGEPQWYCAKSAINTNRINPAHILHEAFTDTEWGYGKPAYLLSNTVWMPVADVLYDEGFGLAMKWAGDQSLDDFIKDVLRHIDGIIHEDHSTGEIVLKLIRDDYDVDDLETFGEDDIESIDDFSRDMPHKVPNVTSMTYTDIVHNKTVSIKYSDMALMNLQGGREVPNEVSFLGIVDDDLAAQLIVREQNQFSLFPAYMKIRAKRTMAHLCPGSVFKLNYTISDVTIEEMVIRILDVDYGSLEDGYVVFDCMEDIFGLPNAQFSVPQASYWQTPDHEAEDVVDYELAEVPYYTLVKRSNQSVVALYDDDAGFVMAAAAKPTIDSILYELLVRESPTSEFVTDGSGNFTPTGTIDADLPMDAADVLLTLNDAENLSSITIGSYALIGNEIVKVLDVDTDTDQVEVARGCLDTVPAAHSEDDRIWFIESVGYVATPEYTDTDQPGVKFLTETARTKLDEDDATAHNADAMNSRMIRPYPPGNFKINSVSYPKCFTGEPTISWSHRDRTQQITTIVEHSNADIGPEAGVTYTLKIYDASDTLQRTETGLTGTNYTYTEANEISDCGSVQIRLRFVLYAVRAGYDSWQQFNLQVPRTIEPPPATAVAGKVDPTIFLGSIILSPTEASAIASGADPTVVIS